MIRRPLALLPLAALLTFGTATTAEAATPRAESGDRCTIVGTSRSDVLTGTSRRDVICGLGGNDVLRGLGGDDVLDEGSGRGRVYGGDGADRLYGGRDGDRLSGGGGSDRLSGGSGEDDMDGGTGDDRLTGGSAADELDGGVGNDRLAGDSGNDRLLGGDGRDSLTGGTGDDAANGGEGSDAVAGGTGRDTVAGGGGNDVLRGDDDGDRLLGGDGNDDLDGGAGADGLDGGPGTNWCIVGAEDTQKACVYDKTAPRVLAVQALPQAVDVTDAGRDVVLRAHIVDDTGVQEVFLSTDHADTNTENRLVSGTVRDGWWETTVRVRRYAPAGSYPGHFQVRDRVGRHTRDRTEDVLTVASRNPDTSAPVVSELQISPAQVDVRKASAMVTVTARITDSLAGMDLNNVLFRGPDGHGRFGEAEAGGTFRRVSGTARDGRYRALVEVAKGAPGGPWSIDVGVQDAVGNATRYLGEDLWRYETGGVAAGTAGPISLPGGRLLVTGSAVDTSPPELVEARVDTPIVDTLPRDAAVTVDLHLRDAGEGVTTLLALIDTPDLMIVGEVRQLSGTMFDGWWRVTFRLPQGMPPATYTPSYTVHDRRNGVGFLAPAAGGTAGSFRTAAGDAWDGTITVAANPAG